MLRTVASDLVLQCFSLSHKKDAKLANNDPIKALNTHITSNGGSLNLLLLESNFELNFHSSVHLVIHIEMACHR